MRPVVAQALEELSAVKKEQDDLKAENTRLQKQHLEDQSALVASRTDREVEQDRIRKAVQGATAARDKRSCCWRRT